MNEFRLIILRDWRPLSMALYGVMAVSACGVCGNRVRIALGGNPNTFAR